MPPRSSPGLLFATGFLVDGFVLSYWLYHDRGVLTLFFTRLTLFGLLLIAMARSNWRLGAPAGHDVHRRRVDPARGRGRRSAGVDTLMDRRLLRRFLEAYPYQPATAVWRASEVAALASVTFPHGLGLDLGCGDGRLTRIVSDEAGGLRLVGLDIDPEGNRACPGRRLLRTRAHVFRGDHPRGRRARSISWCRSR